MAKLKNEKIIEITENEFVCHQSSIIDNANSVTIEKARQCVREVQEESNTTLRRSRRARKRTHFHEFMYNDV